MIAVREQVKMGLLVCPQTKTRLTWDGAGLMSEAGRKYRITEHGTPILLSNPDSAEQYAASSPQMLKEYSNGHFWCWDKIVPSLRSWIRKDYRTHASQRAVDEVLKCGQGDRMCLSIGGGPMRVSPDVTNLNIGNFRNVDVIGDALLLPYADSSVDSIYCEAVLEHLTDPTVAVSEMFRVLKPTRQSCGYYTIPAEISRVSVSFPKFHALRALVTLQPGWFSPVGKRYLWWPNLHDSEPGLSLLPALFTKSCRPTVGSRVEHCRYCHTSAGPSHRTNGCIASAGVDHLCAGRKADRDKLRSTQACNRGHLFLRRCHRADLRRVITNPSPQVVKWTNR